MDYVTNNLSIVKEPEDSGRAAVLAYDMAFAKLKKENCRKEKKNHV